MKREEGDRIANVSDACDRVSDRKTVTVAALEIGAEVGWSVSTVAKLYQRAQRGSGP